jgi:tetratricopeptide (TPR) repeat protein
VNESRIFAAALELATPAQRAAYLDAACAGDPALRGAVEALLRAHETDPGFLERPAGSVTGPVDAPAAAIPGPVAAERPGALLAGRYKLLEPIGEGGMGSVWMAQQQQPVKRLVAVKLIQPGLDSRQVLARFEAERQALALMDHPNIARVLDAGAAPDGRPFFVMELVKGRPLTAYCDARRLTPRQRLELFVPVCQAMQHAHQKGIIHRDLKPSNVLVAEYDGRPVPKVIDFGVAKAAGPPLTERTLQTGFGAVVGTPEYMSPEQASFNQLDVDTRSDIYALGVLLYELLTGSPPFPRAELERAGVLEMLRVIREREPTKPSTRLSTAEGLPTLAANRGTEPGRLARLVRGELDWIVMKALEKDRNRRYETANGLAADVRRYLADEVVEARPPSAGYRLGKFVRRNRLPLAAGAALAVAVVAGGGAVLAVQAKADRDRAARTAWAEASVAAAVREARERADEAWGVADYPERMQRATEAAVAAVRRADDYAAGGPPGEATRAELAATRRIVDELARHTRLITTDAANEEKIADEFSRTSAWDLGSLSREPLRQFGLDPINGPADEVARAIAASRIRDTLLGMLLKWHLRTFAYAKFHPERSDHAADTSVISDRLERVIRSARQLSGGAYARWQDLLDRHDVPALVAFAASPDGLSFRSSLVGALGQDLQLAKEFAASRAYLRAAVERYPHDPWLHFALAAACKYDQPPDFAEALRHDAAASGLRPDAASFHRMVAMDYAALGSYDRAIAAYRKVIAMAPGHADLANFWMGEALSKKKDWAAAIVAYREAIRLLPRGSQYLSTAHVNLGAALIAAGREAEADAAFRESLRLQPDDPQGLKSLGGALADAGRPAEALRRTRAALGRNPAWAEDPRNDLRYSAAGFAMNCADGKGTDVPPPSERPAYRAQALDLLTAELAAIRKLTVTDGAFVHQHMAHWLGDKDLQSGRDPKAVERLPQDERAAWAKLWANVRELRDATAPPTGSAKPND